MIEKDSDDDKRKIIIIIILLFLLITLIASKFLLNSSKDSKKESSNEETNIENRVPLEDEKYTNTSSDIDLIYEKETYTITSDNKKVTISSMRNTIKNTKDDNINKAIDTINSKTNEYWEELKKQMDEQLETINEEGFENEESYGVNYLVTDYSNNKILTFLISTTGSMGGVAWNQEEGYTFLKTTGELLTLSDLCIDENKCKDFLYDYFMLQLQEDPRYEHLYEDFKEVVRKDIFTSGNWYLNEKGLVLTVQKYEISDGGDGMFTYTVSYKTLNEYLNEEFK